jgi:hypothetical protein
MAEMEGMIKGAFAQALKNNRDKLNTKFAYARHAYPSLDGEAFKEHLQALVAPIIEAVDRVAPDGVEHCLLALYDFSLDLIGKGMLGAETRYPALMRGWHQLFAQFPHLLAADPATFAGAVSNALYNLSINQNTRPDFWINEMLRIGNACTGVQAFLEVGKIVAWRSGMAHYRDGALDSCLAIDPQLALEALCIREGEKASIEVIVEKLRRDPWLSPWVAASEAQNNKRLKIASVVGAFRGFGGLFISPPEVMLSDGDFYVFDNDNCWLMTADLFGATLHRYGAKIPNPDKWNQSGFTFDKGGMVKTGSQQLTFPELQMPSSFAANENTLAVTVPISFGVYLVALTEI